MWLANDFETYFSFQINLVSGTGNGTGNGTETGNGTVYSWLSWSSDMTSSMRVADVYRQSWQTWSVWHLRQKRITLWIFRSVSPFSVLSIVHPLQKYPVNTPQPWQAESGSNFEPSANSALISSMSTEKWILATRLIPARLCERNCLTLQIYDRCTDF